MYECKLFYKCIYFVTVEKLMYNFSGNGVVGLSFLPVHESGFCCGISQDGSEVLVS